MRKILMLMIGGVALTATFVASAVSAQPADDPPVLLRRNPNPGAHWLRDYDASHPKQNQMRNRPQFGSRNFGDGGRNMQSGGGDFHRPRNAQFGGGQSRQNGFGMQSGGNFRHRHHHHGHRHHHRF